MEKEKIIKEKIRLLINSLSLENECDTPDFINCLNAFIKSTNERKEYFGGELR